MKQDNIRQGDIGIALTLLSAILVLFWFFMNLKYPFISVDEWYTYGLCYFDLSKMLSVTSVDVHPPLHYIILKAALKILSVLNISYDLLFFIKFMSLVPYLIILGLSLTKVRRQHGILAGGIFAFSLIGMSEFFLQYSTARMYSWMMLFMVLSFMSFYDILKDNDGKSWALFTIFNVLAAYTHYYSLFSVFILYVILIFHLLKNRHSFRIWVFSAIACIAAYVPQLIVLANQMSHANNPGMGGVSLTWVIKILADGIASFRGNMVIITVCAALMCIVMIAVAKRYLGDKDIDNFYLFSGVIVLAGTIAMGFAVSMLFKPIILERYFVACFGILWYSFSIYVSKIDSKKAILIVLCGLLIVSAVNIDSEHNWIIKHHDETLKSYGNIDKINSNDSIVFYVGVNKHTRLHAFFDKVYDSHLVELEDIANGSSQLDEAFDAGKNIYVVDAKDNRLADSRYNITKVATIKPCGIYRIEG